MGALDRAPMNGYSDNYLSVVGDIRPTLNPAALSTLSGKQGNTALAGIRLDVILDSTSGIANRLNGNLHVSHGETNQGIRGKTNPLELVKDRVNRVCNICKLIIGLFDRSDNLGRKRIQGSLKIERTIGVTNDEVSDVNLHCLTCIPLCVFFSYFVLFGLVGVSLCLWSGFSSRLNCGYWSL